MSSSDNAGVRFPPPLIFLLSIGAGLLGDRLFGFPSLGLPPAFRWTLAAVSAAAALGIAGSALLRFHRAGTRPEPWEPSTTFVESGVYAFTRNPMYLGMALLQIAIALAFSSPGALAATLASILLVDRFVISREERYLERRFGDTYRKYSSRVRRWL